MNSENLINTLKMRKIHFLTLIGACSFPSLAYANLSHVDGGLVLGVLGAILLAMFLLFFLLANFRDRQNRLRYVFICISSIIISFPAGAFLAALMSVFRLPISFSAIFISLPLLFLIGGIVLAEYKAEKSKKIL